MVAFTLFEPFPKPRKVGFAYLRLPPRRVWFFLKHIRLAFLGQARPAFVRLLAAQTQHEAVHSYPLPLGSQLAAVGTSLACVTGRI